LSNLHTCFYCIVYLLCPFEAGLKGAVQIKYYYYYYIPGKHVVFDDIIVAANNEAEHDATLRVVLERARKHDVRFNKDKLQYRVPQVK
jgi:hypothetical protein